MRTPPLTQPLKLRAEGPEDLSIIASCLQDAVMPIGALHYDAPAHEFRLLTNRFCWESEPGRFHLRPYYQRTKCGICFQNIFRVQQKGIDYRHPTKVLELLDMYSSDSHEIYLVFAGDVGIKLLSDNIKCFMSDTEETWWTDHAPQHNL